jgi:hypothetical protein
MRFALSIKLDLLDGQAGGRSFFYNAINNTGPQK